MAMGSFSNIKLDLTTNENNNNNFSNQVILAIDIGTTNLKCCLYDENLQVLHTCTSKLEILSPNKGYSEIDSSYLLALIKTSLKSCIKNKPSSYIIKSFGISTQRNSIILWNKTDGTSYCNIILWNDKRPVDITEAWNKGIALNAIKSASYLASLAGTSIAGHRLKTFSQFKVDTNHVTPKLKSQLNILENSLESGEMDNVLYGTIETWLLWHLSKEKAHATDVTCASSTGMYDMYHRKWSPLLGALLSIPTKLFPKVCDTCHLFGHLRPEILDLDYEVPITAIASVVAESAHETGDCVITIGTGAFISVVIGDRPLSSSYGFYPLVSYKKNETSLYILHGGISSAGVAIEWAKSIGLFNDYKEFNDTLKATENSSGVRFIGAFGYLEMEGINKSKVGTGFIGITRETTKAHMLRAVVDSIVFSIKIKFDSMLKDLKTNKIALRSVKVTGGVAQSEFFCQYLANILENVVERSEVCSSSSVYGAAFLAGVGSKAWTKLDDLEKYRTNVRHFKPSSLNESSNNFFNRDDCLEWKKALEVYAEWE